MNRLKVIDGLRAVAVLGVLWAHIWMFLDAPAGKLAGIDIARFISFFGTGVDLFFVISGFCMYLMYTSRQTVFSTSYFLQYLGKRWKRIAPAFYVAIIVYAVYYANFQWRQIDVTYMLRHALFIKNVFPVETQYAPHFWSLCTEWHFYLVLPLLVWGIFRFGFWRTMLTVTLSCLIIRGVFWLNQADPYNVKNYSIPNRLIEFLMGIIAAKLYLDKTTNWLTASVKGLLLGGLIAFTGRLLMTAGLQGRGDMIGLIARVFDLPLLTAGFALFMLNALQCTSAASSFLSKGWMVSIGKYSYSMYLWHWIISQPLSFWMKGKLDIDPFLMVNLLFLISVAVLYPLSYLSYTLFESFYFKKRKAMAPVAQPGISGTR